jgi:hypothetical protein
VRTQNFSCLWFTWSHIWVSPLVTAAFLLRSLPSSSLSRWTLGASASSPATEHPRNGSCCKPPPPRRVLLVDPSPCHLGHPSPVPWLALSGLPLPPCRSGRTTFTKVMFVQNVETKELLCGEPIQLRFALLFQSTVPSVSCLDLTVVLDLLVCAERDKR